MQINFRWELNRLAERKLVDLALASPLAGGDIRWMGRDTTNECDGRDAPNDKDNLSDANSEDETREDLTSRGYQ